MGCSLFARRYWGNRDCFLFLGVLRWFTSPRYPHTPYGFRSGFPDITPGWLPHSEIPGSKLACSSPGLIAACCVLRRLPAPRHPPYALSSLTSSQNSAKSFAFTPMLAMSKTEPFGDTSWEASIRFSPARAGLGISKNLWNECNQPGGEYRVRTGDLLVANQALSQLS